MKKMISINRIQSLNTWPATLMVALITILNCILQCHSYSAIPYDEQLFRSNDQLNQLFASASSATGHSQAHHNIPGHYEFEVAPKMEPPSVRKPPYQQSAQLCPGSDPFAAFSPRDTLCGDLNQGQVPLNPLGQNILEQSYPFELIKNKTLQFLAKALPVLKSEYETIPKVARYMPQQQLFNPTNQISPLTSDHFNQLNQNFAAANGFTAEELMSLASVPYLRQQQRKRRKRSPSVQRSSSAGPHDNMIVSIAELSPNATLIVSSAHSKPGIKLNGNESSLLQTKDGYRMFQSNPAKGANIQRAPGHTIGGLAQPAPQAATQDSGANKIKPTPSSSLSSNLAPNNVDKTQSLMMVTTKNQVEVSGKPSQPPLQQEREPQQSKPISHRSAESPAKAEPALVQARSRGSEAQASSGSPQSAPQLPVAAKPTTDLPPIKRSKPPCSDSGSKLFSAICQAVSALTEGDTNPPPWMKLAKTLGSNFYAATSDSTSANPLSQSNLLWTLLGSLTPDTTAKNSQGISKMMSILEPLNLLGNLKSSESSSVENKETSGPAQKSSPSSLSTLSTVALITLASSALRNMVDYFVPSAFNEASNTFSKRKKLYDSSETFVDTPASLAASAGIPMSTSSSRLMQSAGKQPPTPCPSVEEYISPTFARNYQGAWKYVVQIPHEGYFTQTIQRTSCVRKKCEFTDGVCHESPRWVSLLVAEIYYPNAVYAAQQANQMEQQQLAASASINNIQHQMAQQQQQSHGAQPKHSASAQHGDPMQMTDSLNTAYNQNLNNAFINAANELGWDPNNVANMQHLANAYNYQLMQRNGLTSSQPNQGLSSAESRMSQTFAAAPAGLEVGNQISPAANQFATSQYADANGHQQQVNYNDYIASLAAEVIRQNSGMTINDLISNLQAQPTRRKRDLQSNNQIKLRQLNSVPNSNQPSVANQQMAQLRSNTESMPSMNDIASSNAPSGNQQSSFKPTLDSQAQVSSSNQPSKQDGGSQHGDQQQNQMECDGHDKIGCYVVRVYYDWFLVNGSCKCWKTTNGSSGGGSSSSSSSSNSFLRRIFTG